jgi:hypothetical protein
MKGKLKHAIDREGEAISATEFYPNGEGEAMDTARER